VVTFPTTKHYWPLNSTKLYFLLTDGHVVCTSCYLTMEWPEVKHTTSKVTSQMSCNYYTIRHTNTTNAYAWMLEPWHFRLTDRKDFHFIKPALFILKGSHLQQMKREQQRRFAWRMSLTLKISTCLSYAGTTTKSSQFCILSR